MKQHLKTSAPSVLTIAGSDSGGGAGIQADLKTFAALDLHGCSAITAVTAQNTRTVSGIWPLSPPAVVAQIDAVLCDFNIRAIKLGMLFSSELVEAIAEVLARHSHIPVICDPVMVATTGASLAGEQTAQQQLAQSICEHLFPRALLLTPNIEEASVLISVCEKRGQNAILKKAQTIAEMRAQATALINAGANAVLIKGGHLPLSLGGKTVDQSVDVLCWRDKNSSERESPQSLEFNNDYIDTRNTHGTGCTLSSAIAAQIAKGDSLSDAVTNGNRYVHGAIVAAQSIKLGGGSGPLQHFYQFNSSK